MLTIILTLAFSHTPTQLPLPNMPGVLSAAQAKFVVEFSSPLDQVNISARPHEPSNFEKWRNNNRCWVPNDFPPARLPTQAKEVRRPERSDNYSALRYGSHPVDLSTTGLVRAECSFCERYLPWHAVFTEHAVWHEQFPVCDVIWYKVIQHPTTESGYYVAEIDGLSHLKVRANTIEELGKKIVERFACFVESLTDSELYPTTLPERNVKGRRMWELTPPSWTPPAPWFDEDFIAGRPYF